VISANDAQCAQKMANFNGFDKYTVLNLSDRASVLLAFLHLNMSMNRRGPELRERNTILGA
jgi:hypothetical protein